MKTFYRTIRVEEITWADGKTEETYRSPGKLEYGEPPKEFKKERESLDVIWRAMESGERPTVNGYRYYNGLIMWKSFGKSKMYAHVGDRFRRITPKNFAKYVIKDVCETVSPTLEEIARCCGADVLVEYVMDRYAEGFADILAKALLRQQ